MVRNVFSVLLPALFVLSCYGIEGNDNDSIKHAIEIAPFQLFRATFKLRYEHKLGKNVSLNVGLSGTYGSKGGYGTLYLKNQEYDLSYNQNGYFYSPSMITGWGIEIQARNYLAKDVHMPRGLYAAPFASFREVWLTSVGYIFETADAASYQSEKTRELYIMSAGVLIGGRVGVISNLFSIDIFAGAGLRLSKYADEKTLTRFNRWSSLDYSGVLPTAGVNIGILK